MDGWLADLQRYSEEETRRDVELTSAVILGRPIQPFLDQYYAADVESLRVAISKETSDDTGTDTVVASSG